MIFETKRLILRPWRESDAEELYKYAKSSDVGPIAGWPIHTSAQNSKEIIKNVLSADGTFAVVLKETGLPVGSIGIMYNVNIPTAEGECEIGYWIGKPYWGQGLIPEATNEIIRYCFEELNIHLIWCGYYDGNEKSKRVQEKCGFTYHHTNYDVPCVLMGDVRTEHITCLTKEVWQKKYRYKDLKTIPGVGKDMEQHFFDVGIHTIDDLKEANPEELYEKACIIKGCSIDKCVLYVFRLAVYYANNEVHEPEKLKWWYWKDKNTDEYTNLHK